LHGLFIGDDAGSPQAYLLYQGAVPPAVAIGSAKPLATLMDFAGPPRLLAGLLAELQRREGHILVGNEPVGGAGHAALLAAGFHAVADRLELAIGLNGTPCETAKAELEFWPPPSERARL
jgi:hypothetical protein